MKSLKNFISFRVPDGGGGGVSGSLLAGPQAEAAAALERRRLPWRRLGCLVACAAVALLTVAALPGAHWHQAVPGARWVGLWDASCGGGGVGGSVEGGGNRTTSVPEGCAGSSTSQQLQDWQKAAIGLLLFALLFTTMGTSLAVLGLCVSYLPKKMYYFHSAGEIFFVAALSSTVALGVYPYAVQKVLSHSHRYGFGYAFGWVAAVLLLVSALCMMLDDLVREASRPCGILCCAKSASSRSRQQSHACQQV